jgi:hypothetical protein
METVRDQIAEILEDHRMYQNFDEPPLFLADKIISLIGKTDTVAISPAAMPGSAYWYFVYTTGNDNVKCHKITEEHPVDFAIRCSDKYPDGPYIVTFAMPISEERFKKHGPREA